MNGPIIVPYGGHATDRNPRSLTRRLFFTPIDPFPNKTSATEKPGDGNRRRAVCYAPFLRPRDYIVRRRPVQYSSAVRLLSYRAIGNRRFRDLGRPGPRLDFTVNERQNGTRISVPVVFRVEDYIFDRTINVRANFFVGFFLVFDIFSHTKRSFGPG